jgi:hypothetical protein
MVFVVVISTIKPQNNFFLQICNFCHFNLHETGFFIVFHCFILFELLTSCTLNSTPSITPVPSPLVGPIILQMEEAERLAGDERTRVVVQHRLADELEEAAGLCFDSEYPQRFFENLNCFGLKVF